MNILSSAVIETKSIAIIDVGKLPGVQPIPWIALTCDAWADFDEQWTMVMLNALQRRRLVAEAKRRVPSDELWPTALAEAWGTMAYPDATMALATVKTLREKYAPALKEEKMRRFLCDSGAEEITSFDRKYRRFEYGDGSALIYDNNTHCLYYGYHQMALCSSKEHRFTPCAPGNALYPSQDDQDVESIMTCR